MHIGRSEYELPEVDNEVIIQDRDLNPGEFCRVRITEAREYDLAGVPDKV